MIQETVFEGRSMHMQKDELSFRICEVTASVPGVIKKGRVISFCAENRGQADMNLLLIPKADSDRACGVLRIPMKPISPGSVLFSVGLRDLDCSRYTYAFEIGKTRILDPKARKILGRDLFGEKERQENSLSCGIPASSPFHWGTDQRPCIPKEEMILYKLHVRGFSMQCPGMEEKAGTFLALTKKLSYFKKLGITSLELMPVYEFEEFFSLDPAQKEYFPKDKINYWGYTKGNYFAVKKAYLSAGSDEREFKKMVRTMHRMGMECILEFYFPASVNPHEALESLRFWNEEYHVDGFHIIGGRELAGWIRSDYSLSGRKLFFDWFSPEDCASEDTMLSLYSYNDSFRYPMIRAMNGHGLGMKELADVIVRQEQQQGIVNYIATNNGFCLKDLFSYFAKHNEANGEGGRDGEDPCYTDHCGIEGEPASRSIRGKRMKQCKNALFTLILARGIPLLYMGDEDGNTQSGNNNAYCQDNSIGWKDWKNRKENRQLRDFVQELIAIRKAYPQLSDPEPSCFTDPGGCGYPDLSFHGESAWSFSGAEPEQVLGILYAKDYARHGEHASFLFAAYNFSVEPKDLALPLLPKDFTWHVRIATASSVPVPEDGLSYDTRSISLEAQSVLLLIADHQDPENMKQPARKNPQPVEKETQRVEKVIQRTEKETQRAQKETNL